MCGRYNLISNLTVLGERFQFDATQLTLESAYNVAPTQNVLTVIGGESRRAGFEHSVANMYFLPLGLLIATEPEAVAAAGLTAGQLDRMNVLWVAHNLAAVSLATSWGEA